MFDSDSISRFAVNYCTRYVCQAEQNGSANTGMIFVANHLVIFSNSLSPTCLMKDVSHITLLRLLSLHLFR